MALVYVSRKLRIYERLDRLRKKAPPPALASGFIAQKELRDRRIAWKRRPPWKPQFRPKHITYLPPPPDVIVQMAWKRPLARMHRRPFFKPQFRPKHVIFVPTQPVRALAQKHPLARMHRRPFFKPQFRPRHLEYFAPPPVNPWTPVRHPLPRWPRSLRRAFFKPQFRPKHLAPKPAAPSNLSWKKAKAAQTRFRRKQFWKVQFRPEHILGYPPPQPTPGPPFQPTPVVYGKRRRSPPALAQLRVSDPSLVKRRVVISPLVKLRVTDPELDE